MAQYFLEVCYVESSYFANELKTIVVCSALAVARFVLLEEPWPDTAEEVTGVTNYQLLECSREMFHVVSKEQSCPVMSPVYQKYSTPHVRKLSLLLLNTQMATFGTKNIHSAVGLYKKKFREASKFVPF